MARTLDKEGIKKVITELKKGPKTWTDLLKLSIPRKSLERILQDYLQYWGLSTKNSEGKWAWFEHIKVFKGKDEYEMLLKHSMRLIPGIKVAIYQAENEGDLMQSLLNDFLQESRNHELDSDVLGKIRTYFIEHLRTGYYEVSHKMEELEKRKETLEENGKKYRKKVIEHLLKPIEIPIDSSCKYVFRSNQIPEERVVFSSKDKRRYIKSMIEDILTYLYVKRLTIPSFEYDKDKKELVWGDIILAVSVSEAEARNIQKVVQGVLNDGDLINGATQLKNDSIRISKLQSEIVDSLREIEARIRVGDVIDGTCTICRALEIVNPKT